MEIIFQITYHTSWGQQLFVNIDELGLMAMTCTGNGVRQSGPAINLRPGDVIHYSYLMRESDGEERREWGEPRERIIAPGVTAFVDRWHDRPKAAPFYSKAFTRCFFAHKGDSKFSSYPEGKSLTIIVDAPQTSPAQRMLLSGSLAELGEWAEEKAMKMCVADTTSYAATISLPEREFAYKVIVRDAMGKPCWEKGSDRTINPSTLSAADHIVIEDNSFESPLPLWRGAGVAIPVFSLRSEDDWGIGDFIDLIKLADWTASTGQQIIQILPINDTTMTGSWTDSYPYNSISSFALHPIYLRPEMMGTLKDDAEMAAFREEAIRLNSLPTVDYEGAFKLKSRYYRRIYAQDGAKTIASDEYKIFVDSNKAWLEPYAAFCMLRDLHSTSDMSQWGDYATYSPEKVAKLIEENPSEANYWIYLQYHLDSQLHTVCNYCHSNGIAIKGDIPIGISRTSVDAWVNPGLLYLNTSAGAPPDDFAILGQNWGFPTYNWDAMSRDGFKWWRQRLMKMAEYFDAYRIDHVLGFFRIWQIPLNAIHGLLGVFYPALPYSVEEIASFDFPFNEEMTRPHITDSVIAELFGELVERVKSEYLTNQGNGRYELKSEVSTQRKIAEHFRKLPDQADNDRIVNGLLTLVDDVLFIRDPHQTSKLHPRITGSHTYAYRDLSESDRRNYDRLYEHFYYHRNDEFWREKALWKLPPLIDATQMLCCAEDLGMIPACVPSVMDSLEMLSLKVQRMPSEFGLEFGMPERYPYYSVCTTSTHDMGGIRQWWEENGERIKRFFNSTLHVAGQPSHYAEPWICDLIIGSHLASPSMLCILPLQDWMSIDGDIRRTDPREEQINDPANPANNWNYRMHLTLEQLADAKAFAARVRKMISASGR